MVVVSGGRLVYRLILKDINFFLFLVVVGAWFPFQSFNGENVLKAVCHSSGSFGW